MRRKPGCDLDEIIDEAQQQSIVIRRQGREIAIMLSVAAYERLRVAAVSDFLALRNDVAREAKFPQQAEREAPAIIAGEDFAKLLSEVDEPYKTRLS